MSTSPVNSFTGISTFSTALQNALTRAVSIASLPIQQLTNQKNTFDSQATELGQIGTLFTNVGTALTALSSGSGGNSLTATASDPSVINASLTGSALPGTYTIQVLDPGSSSVALSNLGSTAVTDPSSQSISQSGSFTLSVGGTNYTLTPSSNSLNALAASINASGAPVQATIINLGSPSAPDYRLALQSTNLGDVDLQLSDVSGDLLGSVTSGTSASYTVNGQPPGGITSNAKTVTIAPGLTVDLLTAGSSTVTVASSTNSISSALTSFVSAFNAAIAELQKNRGQNGGPLTGDSSVNSLQNALRQIVNYTGPSGNITSLTQLGIEFTAQGTLTFDPSKLSGLSQDQIGDVQSFLGDPLSGGFLKAASDTLAGLLDPVSGSITTELQTFESESQAEAQQISDAQDRVNQLQTNLTAQMSAADALIATLQQQTQFIAGLFNIPQVTSNGTLSNSGSSSS